MTTAEAERDAAVNMLFLIRDSTFRDAAHLRGMADDCINRINAGDYIQRSKDGGVED